MLCSGSVVYRKKLDDFLCKRGKSCGLAGPKSSKFAALNNFIKNWPLEALQTCPFLKKIREKGTDRWWRDASNKSFFYTAALFVKSAHPYTGCNLTVGGNLDLCWTFQSTHLYTGCDANDGTGRVIKCEISIHTSLHGMWRQSVWSLYSRQEFQSTHPYTGCDCKKVSFTTVFSYYLAYNLPNFKTSRIFSTFSNGKRIHIPIFSI